MPDLNGGHTPLGPAATIPLTEDQIAEALAEIDVQEPITGATPAQAREIALRQAEEQLRVARKRIDGAREFIHDERYDLAARQDLARRMDLPLPVATPYPRNTESRMGSPDAR